MLHKLYFSGRVNLLESHCAVLHCMTPVAESGLFHRDGQTEASPEFGVTNFWLRNRPVWLKLGEIILISRIHSYSLWHTWIKTNKWLCSSHPHHSVVRMFSTLVSAQCNYCNVCAISDANNLQFNQRVAWRKNDGICTWCALSWKQFNQTSY